MSTVKERLAGKVPGEDTGIITRNSFCGVCAVACSYGAPSFRANGEKPVREKMEKCHGSLSRIEAGLAPACVHSCPTGALTWCWAEDDVVNRLGELYENWSAVR